MNLVFFFPPRRVEEGQRKDGRAGADCARRSARICLCRLRTHYNLGKHIRSLSPYTKLSLIMDTALQLFCSLFPSPPALPPPSTLLPRRPTLPFPPVLLPTTSAARAASQEPWQVCIHHHGAGHTARRAQTVSGERHVRLP